MILQKEIQRIQEVMFGINESVSNSVRNEVIQIITKRFNGTIDRLRNSFPKLFSNIINQENMIQKFKRYYISRLPYIFDHASKGKDANIICEEVYSKIKEIIKEELDNIGFIKKNAVKLMLPNKSDYIRQSKENSSSNYDNYIEYFEYPIGLWYLDDYDDMWEDNKLGPVAKNIDNYGYQMMDWSKKNKDRIIKEINSLIINKFYT